MIDYVRQAAKAVFAFLVAGLGSLQVALLGHESFGELTAGQWVGIISAAVIAGGGVYGIANKAPGDLGEQAGAPAAPE